MVVDDGSCHHRRVESWACHATGYVGALLIEVVVEGDGGGWWIV